MSFETAPTYIFDLHCDTLDRLALHKSFPDAGFMEQDSAISDVSCRRSRTTIAISHSSAGESPVCLVPVLRGVLPDHMPADWGWQVFFAVRDFLPVSARRACRAH